MADNADTKIGWLCCPKCKYTCVIRFKDGKIEELKMPDA